MQETATNAVNGSSEVESLEVCDVHHRHLARDVHHSAPSTSVPLPFVHRVAMRDPSPVSTSGTPTPVATAPDHIETTVLASKPAAYIAIAKPATQVAREVRIQPTVAVNAAQRKMVTPMSTETVVLPPDYKGVFVSDGDRHGGRGRDNYDVYDGTERVKDTVMAGISANHVAIEKGMFAGVVATEKTAAGVSVAVERNGRSSELAVEKLGAAGILATERTAAATQLATERTAAQNAAAVALGFATNASAQQAGYAAIELGQVKGFGDASVQATMFASASALAAATNTQTILRSQEVASAATALAFAVNTAAIQAKLAECCCESKALVLAQSNEVKALINAQDQRRSDRELVQANAEIMALKYCRGPHLPFPPMPV